MKFEKINLLSQLQKAIKEEGFVSTTDIQYKAIPNILRGEDLLAIAQTGTGKTAAFVLPLLNLLHRYNTVNKNKKRQIQTVVMVPTRELARQVGDVFKKFGKYTNVRSLAIYGGVEQGYQTEALQNGVDVLIATPGRLFDLNYQGFIDLKQVKYVVLDEADHMLNLGFIKDIRDLMKILPKKRQTLFFSATIDKEIKKIAYSLITSPKPIRIQIDPEDLVSKNVQHYLLGVSLDEKRFFLEHIIQEQKGKVVVFVRTKVRADRVAKAMNRVGIEVSVVHGGREQDERREALKEFKKGSVDVLVATDVAARGVDIEGVKCVVNYDLPEDPEHYIHRVGRTGRGKEKGEAYTLFDNSTERELLLAIEDLLGGEIERIILSEFDRKDVLRTKGKLGQEETWQDVMGVINQEKEVYKMKKKKRKNRR
ncbi:MAG: DEAD/DEAH box helicase [Cytophagales bacterium]|nr:DEAD/DEAH box helicase [Cytophagales bacterium]